MTKNIIFTVSNLNDMLKNTIIKEFPNKLNINGEVSNIKISGENTYLTIKDNFASIPVVLWNNKLTNITNGDDVFVSGKVNCYQRQGTCQIVAVKIKKIGIGQIYEQYEKLKIECENKNYFSKKRDFPENISRIAILTSLEGAALQDILYVFKSNSFTGEIHLKNCFVQGQSCSKSVVEGIKFYNNLHKTNKFDVLLITRGGGSFEDLMGYSSKNVVKEIYKSDIYTMSAIGHEVDNMLSDYSSDCRAPTPSIGAELISSQQKKTNDELEKCHHKLENIKNDIINELLCMKNSLEMCIHKFNAIQPKNMIDNTKTDLDNIKLELHRKMKFDIHTLCDKTKHIKLNLETYNINNILKKGYCAIIDEDGGFIDSKKKYNRCVKYKKKLRLFFSDGEIEL
jgi:exodeoxyribonuclease VII large subunit